MKSFLSNFASSKAPFAFRIFIVASFGLALTSSAYVKPPCTACGFVYFDGQDQENTCETTLYINECSGASIGAAVMGFSPGEELCPGGAIIIAPLTWVMGSPALGLRIRGGDESSYSAIIEPAGSIDEIESGSITVSVTGMGAFGAPVTWYGTLNVQVGHGPGGCNGPSCGSSAAPSFGNTETMNGSVSVEFALGRRAFGKASAKVLSISSPTPAVELSTPATLKYRFATNSETEKITDDNGIRQFKVPEGLVNVLTNGSNNMYFVEFYPLSQVGAKSNGIYLLSGLPLRTNRIENPEPTTQNKFRITESEGYVSDYEWKTNGWELAKGSGWRKELKTTTWSESNTIKTVVIEIRDTNALVSYTSNRYQVFPFGQRLVESVIGEGTAARTNTFTYHTNSGLSTTGLVRQILRPTGEWEINLYNSDRLPTNKYVAFGNQAPATNPAVCRTLEYTYGNSVVSGSGDSGKISTMTPRRTIEYVLGQEVARGYTVLVGFEERQIQCVHPGAAWDNSSNLVTIRRWYSTNVNAKKLWTTERPDGTMDIYDYKFYTNGGQAFKTNIVLSGAPDAQKTNIVDGTKTITVLGGVGQLLSKTSFDTVSGIQLSSETYSDHDSYNRPRRVAYLDGTSRWTDHGCCGPITETNREGTAIFYYKDALRRQAGLKKNDITTTNVFDAAANLLRTVRIGSDASKITNSIQTYDTAGRMLTSKDALGNTITYAETITNYQVIKTNIFPDGSTRIETYYRDGQLAKVTGTAVHPVRYEYGVIQDDGTWRQYTKEIKLDGNGSDTSEVLTNFFDMVGRNYKTVYADGAKLESFYNVKGQLVKAVDPAGVTTLYEYNTLGEVEYVVTDMDRDGTKDVTGPDRIRQTVHQVTTNGPSNVMQTRIYHWATNGSGVSNVISVSELKTDSLMAWNGSFGTTNQMRTAYTGSGNRYETNTAPDGSYTIMHFQHGQLKSVTRKDANGNQLGQTTYAYDAHGRQKTMTDVRNGTTTYTYDNVDRVASVITPSPGSGQNPQSTSYSYDYAGRRTRTAMPDGGASTNEYHPSGELKKAYGARVYPVEHKYDAQGRQTNMTTWQNYGAGTGAANTSWKYDGLRGFMTNKVYTDGNGPRYTYTPAGRLRTRTWARGVTNTYETNAVGEVVGIAYSDGTSNVVYNLDRLGRRTNIVDGAGVRYLTYTESGLLLVETNASGVLAGVAITNGYDSFGRRVAIVMLTNGSPAFVQTYAYNSASRLTNVSDGTYNASYSYLANSPLVSQITYRSNTTTRMTTTKSYDYLNRLTGISSQPSAAGELPISFNYAHNDANQRTRGSHSDGSYWVYEYDKLGQVTSGKKCWDDATPVAGQQFEYGYDDIGNRTSTKEGGDASGGSLRLASYSANLLNQYTNRTVSGTVDLIGIAKANSTVTVNNQSAYRRGEYYQAAIASDNSTAIVYPSYTNRAVLSAETNTVTGNLLILKTPQSFWYDFDGNITSDGVWTNTWDAENRISATENTSGVPSSARAKETWTFDNRGRWLRRVVYNWSDGAYAAWGTNRFVWHENLLVAILSEQSVCRASFLRGQDLSGTLQAVGGIEGMIAVNLQSNGMHFSAYDGNANIRALVSGIDGRPSGFYEYDPFGRTARLSGASAKENPLRFGTQFEDDVRGSVKYLYRDMQPELGQWRGRDPLEEQERIDQGGNPYCFVWNAPLNYFDPDGRAAVPQWLINFASGVAAQLLNRLIADPVDFHDYYDVTCPRGSSRELLHERRRVVSLHGSVTAGWGLNRITIPVRPVRVSSYTTETYGCCKSCLLFNTTTWSHPPDNVNHIDITSSLNLSIALPRPDAWAQISAIETTRESIRYRSCAGEVPPLSTALFSEVCRGEWPFRTCYGPVYVGSW